MAVLLQFVHNLPIIDVDEKWKKKSISYIILVLTYDFWREVHVFQ